jgi:predicted nucleic acid-binding protein
MKTYADTGFLVSLHTTDANTTSARIRMKRYGAPMPWTWLHEIEFRNAIRLQAFRGQIDSSEIGDILHKQSLGLDRGVYFAANAALNEVTKVAERLGAMHTEIRGTRSLDVMHVALALVLDMKDFLTFDKRQAALAKASGMRVPKLT